jgi:predicted RND superfamily exporter protein
MRERLLKKLAKWQAAHPWRMLAVVLLLTVLFGWSAEHLQLTMRWSDLLPSGDKRTIEFNKVIDEFASATSLTVVVQGEEEKMKAFADQLAPRILTLVDRSGNEKHRKKAEKLQDRLDALKAKNRGETAFRKLEEEITNHRQRIDLKLFRRVDYKNEVDFLKNHGLLLIKGTDLENMKDVFMDADLKGLLFNLNNSMEKEYVGREESISTREKEDQAVALLDGIQDMVRGLSRAARGESLTSEEITGSADKLLYGEPYFLSYDKKALILNAIPNFSMVDTELLVTGTDSVQAVLDELLPDFPGVEAGLTGFIAIGRDEMVYSEQSLGYTTLIALLAIIALLMVSFRMWVAPVLAVVNLLVGLVWAIGTAALVVGQLNIMTQMMAVILLGLGIDFAIHLMSGFTEWRAAGDGIQEALEKTFMKSGKGVLTGGLTTSAAFLTMGISHSRGLKEMGIVTGAGLLAILLATMLFLPVLMVLRERRREKKEVRTKETGKSQVSAETPKKGSPAKKAGKKDLTFVFLGRIGSRLAGRYLITLAAALILTVVFVWFGLRIGFDHNYMNIEPKGLTSISLQDTVLEKFDMSMDYALILTDNPDESRATADKIRDLSTVAMTEDISLYLPSAEQQADRIPLIMDILGRITPSNPTPGLGTGDLGDLSREIDRLRMNVMEIQDMAFLGGQDKVDRKCKSVVGDPEDPGSQDMVRILLDLMDIDPGKTVKGFEDFQRIFSPYFKDAVLRMGTTEPVSLDELPESILDRYAGEDRDQFLVTVFPSRDIWKDAEFLRRFVQDVEGADDRATGMPPVFRALIEIIGQDGGKAMLLTLVVVFFLLWVDFKNPLHALMAMIPLAAGVCWMVGLMSLAGMKLTVMNVMGFPMILGIGIDDGVHIMHRWRHEGPGHIRTVFASTGKAIFLTSLTTMLAFGSLVFSIYRGFGQLGSALFIGVGACFITTVFILPGIFGWIERKHGGSSH